MPPNRRHVTPAGGQSAIASTARALIALALTLSAIGCAASQDDATHAVRLTPGAGATVVFPSEQTAAFYDQRRLLLADRFEYYRNNDAVSARTPVPLLASQQWPQRPEPAERPVRFSRWQQRPLP